MRRRPSPALAVSIAALVLAGTGSATAAALIDGSKLRNNSVSGLKIKDRSLTMRDLSPKTRAALRAGAASNGVAGPQGPKGDPGPQGPKGDPGDGACTLGDVWLTAATNFLPAGTIVANGTVLNITSNQALYALLGAAYGGDGTTTFAVPDLRTAVPAPGMRYVICVEGVFPAS